MEVTPIMLEKIYLPEGAVIEEDTASCYLPVRAERLMDTDVEYVRADAATKVAAATINSEPEYDARVVFAIRQFIDSNAAWPRYDDIGNADIYAVACVKWTMAQYLESLLDSCKEADKLGSDDWKGKSK